MTERTRREFLATTGGLLATSTLAGRELLAQPPTAAAAASNAGAIPPHHSQAVEGVHAYTDRLSLPAGGVVRFHVSSSHPYELQVCRLGPDADSADHDEVLHSFGARTRRFSRSTRVRISTSTNRLIRKPPWPA